MVVVVVTVGSRPKRVEPSGQLAEHCVETLRGDGETCPDPTAHVQLRGSSSAIKAEQNGEELRRAQAEAISMGRCGGKGVKEERRRYRAKNTRSRLVARRRCGTCGKGENAGTAVAMGERVSYGNAGKVVRPA